MRKHYAAFFGYDVVSIWGTRHEIEGKTIWIYNKEELVAGFVVYESMTNLSKIEVYNHETDKFDTIWARPRETEQTNQTKEAVEV